MDSPKRLQQNNCNNDNDAASTSSPKRMDSPKTPVRTPLDDSLEDYDTDEMESPQFPHLIPVYHRRHTEDYDLEGVRIGWDDGFGEACFQDDDYGFDRNDRRLRRSRSGRLFTDRRHRSLFASHKVNNSPSPRHTINHDAIQAELNDYLGCILSCLSAKKRNRQLLKAKNEASSTTVSSTENNNVSHLLNDSADDEMMIMCSQAIENSIAADTHRHTVDSNTSSNSHFSSIAGISPLKNINSQSNNLFNHATKKFKPTKYEQLSFKANETVQSQSSTITSNTENKLKKDSSNSSLSATSTVTNSNNNSSSLLNDSLASDDDLFSALDLSAIEQKIMSNAKETTPKSVTKKCDTNFKKQQQNTKVLNGIENKTGFSSLTNNDKNTGSVSWRRFSSSSSVVNKRLQFPQEKPTSGINSTTITSNSNNTGPTVKRLCTPAEIEAKRERARRTLMLKFKSKNRSAL